MKGTSITIIVLASATIAATSVHADLGRDTQSRSVSLHAQVKGINSSFLTYDACWLNFNERDTRISRITDKAQYTRIDIPDAKPPRYPGDAQISQVYRSDCYGFSFKVAQAAEPGQPGRGGDGGGLPGLPGGRGGAAGGFGGGDGGGWPGQPGGRGGQSGAAPTDGRASATLINYCVRLLQSRGHATSKLYEPSNCVDYMIALQAAAEEGRDLGPAQLQRDAPRSGGSGRDGPSIEGGIGGRGGQAGSGPGGGRGGAGGAGVGGGIGGGGGGGGAAR